MQQDIMSAVNNSYLMDKLNNQHGPPVMYNSLHHMEYPLIHPQDNKIPPDTASMDLMFLMDNSILLDISMLRILFHS